MIGCYPSSLKRNSDEIRELELKESRKQRKEEQEDGASTIVANSNSLPEPSLEAMASLIVNKMDIEFGRDFIETIPITEMNGLPVSIKVSGSCPTEENGCVSMRDFFVFVFMETKDGNTVLKQEVLSLNNYLFDYRGSTEEEKNMYLYLIKDLNSTKCKDKESIEKVLRGLFKRAIKLVFELSSVKYKIDLVSCQLVPRNKINGVVEFAKVFGASAVFNHSYSTCNNCSELCSTRCVSCNFFQCMYCIQIEVDKGKTGCGCNHSDSLIWYDTTYSDFL